jgi:hypothetical protein
MEIRLSLEETAAWSHTHDVVRGQTQSYVRRAALGASQKALGALVRIVAADGTYLGEIQAAGGPELDGQRPWEPAEQQRWTGGAA